MRICFFGDSLTNGVGDTAYQGWVGRLSALSVLPDLTVYNLGVRHQTSAEIAARWRTEAEIRLPSNLDGRLVFAFGVNDCMVEDGCLRLPQAESLAVAHDILAAAVAWKPTLFIGPSPVADPKANGRIRALSAAYAGLCRSLSVPCLEVFDALAAAPAWMDAVHSGDGAHPGPEGYAALASLIASWPSWQAWMLP